MLLTHTSPLLLVGLAALSTTLAMPSSIRRHKRHTTDRSFSPYTLTPPLPGSLSNDRSISSYGNPGTVASSDDRSITSLLWIKGLPGKIEDVSDEQRDLVADFNRHARVRALGITVASAEFRDKYDAGFLYHIAHSMRCYGAFFAIPTVDGVFPSGGPIPDSLRKTCTYIWSNNNRYDRLKATTTLGKAYNKARLDINSAYKKFAGNQFLLGEEKININPSNYERYCKSREAIKKMLPRFYGVTAISLTLLHHLPQPSPLPLSPTRLIKDAELENVRGPYLVHLRCMQTALLSAKSEFNLFRSKKGDDVVPYSVYDIARRSVDLILEHPVIQGNAWHAFFTHTKKFMPITRISQPPCLVTGLKYTSQRVVSKKELIVYNAFNRILQCVGKLLKTAYPDNALDEPDTPSDDAIKAALEAIHRENDVAPVTKRAIYFLGRKSLSSA